MLVTLTDMEDLKTTATSDWSKLTIHLHLPLATPEVGVVRRMLAARDDSPAAPTELTKTISPNGTVSLEIAGGGGVGGGTWNVDVHASMMCIAVLSASSSHDFRQLPWGLVAPGRTYRFKIPMAPGQRSRLEFNTDNSHC